MKYFVLLLCTLSFYFKTHSQIAIAGTYPLAIYNKSYRVEVELDLNDKVIYKIETPRREGLYDKLWLIIRPRKLKRFINLLDNIIETFPKWEKTALNNNVKNVRRQILPYKEPRVKALFSYGDTLYYDSLVFPIAIFIADNGMFYVEIRSIYWMVSDFNQFIKAEPFSIKFNSVEEVQILKDLLDDDLAYDKIIEKMEQENLFKQ